MGVFILLLLAFGFAFGSWYASKYVKKNKNKE